LTGYFLVNPHQIFVGQSLVKIRSVPETTRVRIAQRGRGDMELERVGV